MRLEAGKLSTFLKIQRIALLSSPPESIRLLELKESERTLAPWPRRILPCRFLVSNQRADSFIIAPGCQNAPDLLITESRERQGKRGLGMAGKRFDVPPGRNIP